MSGSEDDKYLNDLHKGLLADFWKFFKAKRDDNVREISAAFEDCSEMQLLDDMYSKDDVQQILDGLAVQVTSEASEELEKNATQMTAFIRQLLLQAEGHGVDLEVDTSVLDDQQLLSRIADMKLEAYEKKARSDKANKLGKLGGNAVDVNLVRQVKTAQKEARDASAALIKLTADHESAVDELKALKAQNAKLSAQVQAANSALDSQNSGANDMLSKLEAAVAEKDALAVRLTDTATEAKELKSQVEKLQGDLRSAKGELQGKISKSKQYQQVKKLLQTRNTTIKGLKAKLRHAEQKSSE